MEWQQPCDHFFRIILDSTMATKKLRLPRLFVKTRIDKLSDSETVKLKAPNSQTWTVGLTVKTGRRNKTPEAWLDAGFSAFLESLSISHGHFLVFEYRGMSMFKVSVYDKTTCEIRYPPCSNAMADSDYYDDDDDDSDDGDSGVQYVGSSFSPPSPDPVVRRRNGSSSSSTKPRPRATAAKI